MNTNLVKVNNVIMQGVKGLGLQYGEQESTLSKAAKPIVRKLINLASSHMITNPVKAKRSIQAAYRLNHRITDPSYRHDVNQVLSRYAKMLQLTLKD